MKTNANNTLRADGHTVRRPDGSVYAVADTTDLADFIATTPELLESARYLLARINNAFYVDGTSKALKPVMADTRPMLQRLRDAIAMTERLTTPKPPLTP